MQRLLFFITLILLASCAKKAPDGPYLHQLSFGPGQETEIREALITISDSTEIVLAEGNYSFERLSIQGPYTNIMFRGAGRDKTIIDFSEQTTGGEGIRVDNVTNFTIRDLQVRESQGDLIKVKDSENVSFINVAAIWEGEPDINNGGYGIYPVLCKNVLVDSSYVHGASDAGIYVGQTVDAVIRNNVAEYNVAGIEIENTINAEVYNNESRNNTGGLLVFDLPGLKYDGRNTRVYDNYVHDNNYRNFAPAANSASGVGNVPPGTGILILRTSDVEVFNNRIIDNNTSCIGIFSFATVDPQIFENNPDWFPVPTNIRVHDNEISKQDNFPEAVKDHELASLLVSIHENTRALSGATTIQHILYDGIVMGEGENPSNICIQEAEGTTFMKMDLANDLQGVSFDIGQFSCDEAI